MLDGVLFVVEGKGQFPYDMLRVDQSWPHDVEDVASLLGDARAPLRRVVLQSNSRYSPTVARWLSFGWRVVVRLRPDPTLDLRRWRWVMPEEQHPAKEPSGG